MRRPSLGVAMRAGGFCSRGTEYFYRCPRLRRPIPPVSHEVRWFLGVAVPAFFRQFFGLLLLPMNVENVL